MIDWDIANMEVFKREVKDELEAAKKKHPVWPTDAVHAAAIVAEETGELLQGALDFHYDRSCGAGHGKHAMRKEAAQATAMLLRFMDNIGNYRQEKEHG